MGCWGMVKSRAEAKPTHCSREGSLCPLLIRQGEGTSDDGVELRKLLLVIQGVDCSKHEHDLRQREAGSEQHKLCVGVLEQGKQLYYASHFLHSPLQLLLDKSAVTNRSPEDDDAITRPGIVRSLYDPEAGTGVMLSVD